MTTVITAFCVYYIFATLLLFLMIKVRTNKPQDPMERKWFNRTEEGSREINKMILNGWDYTHDPDARFEYYKKSGDGWSVTIRADQVFVWQENEGELVFECPWCDEESSHKFADLAVLGMTDHKNKQTANGFIFGCQVISSDECPKDTISVSSDTQIVSRKISESND